MISNLLISPLAQRIINLIITSPLEWKSGDYDITHFSGLRVLTHRGAKGTTIRLGNNNNDEIETLGINGSQALWKAVMLRRIYLANAVLDNYEKQKKDVLEAEKTATIA